MLVQNLCFGLLFTVIFNFSQTSCFTIFWSNELERKSKELFPLDCGIHSSEDRITGGVSAYGGQFPWMALLGFKSPETNNSSMFYCGGSIIHTRYVLTAAHCVDKITPSHFVRVGELDIATEHDECNDKNIISSCIDKYTDIPIELAIPHPQFNNPPFKNDIALLRLKNDIKFTAYVSPICLPFPSIYENNKTPKEYIVSGWGKTKHSGNGMGSNSLQFAKVKPWSIADCQSKIPVKVRPVDVNSQICLNGEKSQDACNGDSGGPLQDIVNEGALGLPTSYQIGIVSFSTGRLCGLASYPTIYTRISNYLSWIIMNVVQ